MRLIEPCTFKVRIIEQRSLKMRCIERRSLKMSVIKRCSLQPSTVERRALQLGIIERRPLKVGSVERCPLKIRTIEIRFPPRNSLSIRWRLQDGGPEDRSNAPSIRSFSFQTDRNPATRAYWRTNCYGDE